jgi:hypothetical protein
MSIAARVAALAQAKADTAASLADDNGGDIAKELASSKIDFTDCGDRSSKFVGLMNQGWHIPHADFNEWSITHE